MKFRLIALVVFFFCGIGMSLAQESLTVISYNVENLFDNKHDTLKNDSSFLHDGEYHWTYRKYQNKLDQIAQVIVNISGWESAVLVGLCEVENARCMRDLCYRLKRFHYKYVHYESEDERGVDVALLYDSTKVKILNSKPLPVDLHEDKTRDILYACCYINNQDTVHTMVCHLPSRLGGGATSEWKRTAAKQVIQQQIDSILQEDAKANIVVMGDMNGEPKNDLKHMYNLMIDLETGPGTHKYKGIWSCLDQFYISEALIKRTTSKIYSPEWLMEKDSKYLDYQPKRTFVGFRYHGGYSDHLPIVLTIQNK